LSHGCSIFINKKLVNPKSFFVREISIYLVTFYFPGCPNFCPDVRILANQRGNSLGLEPHRQPIAPFLSLWRLLRNTFSVSRPSLTFIVP